MNSAGMLPPATAAAAEGDGAGAPVLFPASVLPAVPGGGPGTGAEAACGAMLTTVGGGAPAGLTPMLRDGVAAGCGLSISGDVVALGIGGD